MSIGLEDLIRADAGRFDPLYGMKVLLHDGIAWGPPTTVELVEAVKDFPLDASDVLVTGFPKSGTNWMQIMLANMWDDWGAYRLTGSRRVPSIEFIGDGTDGYDIAIASAPPRLMKNHLPAHAMPRAWPRAKSKVVYLTRNPYDVCASFFGQLQAPGLEFDADWDNWVDRFADGRTLYGGYRDHLFGWHALGPDDGVHHVRYEKLRRDPVGEMRKVVDFLGRPLAEDRFQQVIEDARLENMDESGYSAQITVKDLTHYRRGGQMGEGRDRFSADQLALMQAKVVGPLRAQ
ncbi:MAG: sulfotransferase domain-containing protein, partial [Caulobacteraceae bacterium]|nr:sulfotransferase domain-containing protein [Caulobacteraceae bacterium]